MLRERHRGREREREAERERERERERKRERESSSSNLNCETPLTALHCKIVCVFPFIDLLFELFLFIDFND